MQVLTAEKFFDGHHLHGPTRITLGHDSTVQAIEDHDGPCQHWLLAPGLVDLQMNGWLDINVAGADPAAMSRLDRLLWNEGTSHWLGTIVSAPTDSMEHTLARLDALTDRAPGMIGIHSEGPFLGDRPGAHDRASIVEIDPDFLHRLPGSVRLVTMAAERSGAAEAIAHLRARGIRVSIGHSAPTRRQWDAALASGASMVTHVFNAMSGVHHRDGGLALWALTHEGITCGLIADGHHVSDDIIRLVFAAKSRFDEVVLVSDSVGWLHPGATKRGVSAETGVATLADGTLAGSATSLLGCVRHAVHSVGIDLASALRAATSTPSRYIGHPDAGVVTVGRACNIIALDASLAIQDRSPRVHAD